MDWNTRLEISVGDSVITPVETFTPTITTPIEPIHSIEADNVGFLYKPRTATFSLGVKAIGSSVAELTQLALDGTPFNLQVAEKSGEDWSFKKILFRDCVITQANPSNVTVDGAPLANFQGAILGFGEATDIET